MEEERKQLATLETSFAAKDDISLRSLAEIRDKILNEAAIPGGFQLTILENNLLIYKMDLINDVACIRACITLRPNLEILVTLNGKVIPASNYKDICPVSIESFSQLLNLMALVKSWCEEKQQKSRNAILSLIEQYALVTMQRHLRNATTKDVNWNSFWNNSNSLARVSMHDSTHHNY